MENEKVGRKCVGNRRVLSNICHFFGKKCEGIK